MFEAELLCLIEDIFHKEILLFKRPFSSYFSCSFYAALISTILIFFFLNPFSDFIMFFEATTQFVFFSRYSIYSPIVITSALSLTRSIRPRLLQLLKIHTAGLLLLIWIRIRRLVFQNCHTLRSLFFSWAITTWFLLISDFQRLRRCWGLRSCRWLLLLSS